MTKSKFDKALEYGNYLFFYLDDPSKYFVIAKPQFFENLVFICSENISKNNYIFSSEGNLGRPVQVYFRRQEDLNFFKLITPKEFYANPKEKKTCTTKA